MEIDPEVGFLIPRRYTDERQTNRSQDGHDSAIGAPIGQTPREIGPDRQGGNTQEIKESGE